MPAGIPQSRSTQDGTPSDSPSRHVGYAVRLDGRPAGEYASCDEALAAACAFKREVPEQLVSLWDLEAGRASVVEDGIAKAPQTGPIEPRSIPAPRWAGAETPLVGPVRARWGIALRQVWATFVVAILVLVGVGAVAWAVSDIVRYRAETARGLFLEAELRSTI